ncbi:MAG TPA: glycosyltransferase [Candidatus Limnocylindrales bacterium]
MKLLLLGAPGLGGDKLERWHDDAHDGAVELGWEVDYLRVRDMPAEDIARAAKGADMLLWLRTHNHNVRGDGCAMLRRVEDAGTVTVGLHLDLYWGIRQREQRIGKEPWWTAQHVFTADGGQRDWAGSGVNHRWCPPPFGSRFLGYGTPDPTVQHRAVFIGSMTRSVHTGHRADLLAWARRVWGWRFLHAGSSQRNRLYHLKLNHLYASVDVVLGDSAPAPFYWSDRVPRTLGRGGLLAYPRTEGLAEQGVTSEVAILYDRGEFDQITDQLADLSPARRREMTDAAIQLVRDRHLWRHRLADIAEVVGLG